MGSNFERTNKKSLKEKVNKISPARIQDLVSVKMIAAFYWAVTLSYFILLSLVNSKGTYKNSHFVKCSKSAGDVCRLCGLPCPHHSYHDGLTGLSLRAGGRKFGRLLLLDNRRKIEPKEIPSRLIPRLLVVFTRQLEILVTTVGWVGNSKLCRINKHIERFSYDLEKWFR